MEKNEFLDKIAAGKMTRREFKKALAAAGLAMFSMPLVQRSAMADAEDHPTIFMFAGYDDENFHQPYLEKYGESPNFSFWGDEEEAFAKIRTGFHPDIAMPCSYKVQQWKDAGMIVPIDVGRLSNWGDTISSLKSVPGTVIDGEHYWVCMDWGQTSILYRTDLVDIEEESWGLLWDERYRGRMAMIDSLIDGVMVAAIYAGAANPYDMTPDEVKRTKVLLQEQLPLLRFYSNDMTSIQQALASGELVAAVVWNDSYTFLKGEGHPVAFMSPKEGAMTWTCGIGLTPWAQDLDRSYDFIDAMISPSAGVWEIMDWGLGHANKKAFSMVDATDLKDRGLPTDPAYLDDFLASGSFQEAIQNEPELQIMFEEVKAGF
ncbi:MAG: extracellular solute-binding protein [Alphaproteobacteria bacterium]